MAARAIVKKNDAKAPYSPYYHAEFGIASPRSDLITWPASSAEAEHTLYTLTYAPNTGREVTPSPRPSQGRLCGTHTPTRFRRPPNVATSLRRAKQCCGGSQRNGCRWTWRWPRQHGSWSRRCCCRPRHRCCRGSRQRYCWSGRWLSPGGIRFAAAQTWPACATLHRRMHQMRRTHGVRLRWMRRMRRVRRIRSRGAPGLRL